MLNVVGQTPRGKDFFPRPPIIERIYRRLESGSHLFLSAPRRVGKTSIMRFLEDEPRKGFLFLYVTVEDVADPEQYFRVLSEELLQSEALGKLAKLNEKVKKGLLDFAERFKKIKVFGIEIETSPTEKASFSQEFELLLRNLDTDGTKVCIMVDEFPVALEAIAKSKGNDEAVRFLHTNRSLRQKAQAGIKFIYTGSIGLPNIARKLGATSAINDLSIVEIPPLTREEGIEMSRRIFGSYHLNVPTDTIEHMLDRIEWLMPFFIQLVIQMVIDEAESEGQLIPKEMIDLVLAKASNHRNNIYFENYYSRLDKTLPPDESQTAKEILAEIAHKGLAPVSAFAQANAANVLEILEFDGYIHLDEAKIYRFNSPILRMWWEKFANQ
jgi:uncharacterized protein